MATKTNVGLSMPSIPSEATSAPEAAVQQGGVNNPLPSEVRAGIINVPVSDAAKRGDTGEFLQAAYPLPSGNIRVDL